MPFKQKGYEAGEGTGKRSEARQEKRTERKAERGERKSERITARGERKSDRLTARANRKSGRADELKSKASEVKAKSTIKAAEASPDPRVGKKIKVDKAKVEINTPAKKKVAKLEQSFGSAFKAARKAKGSGKTFTYKGKSYSTNTADDVKSGKSKKPGTKGPVKPNSATRTPMI